MKQTLKNLKGEIIISTKIEGGFNPPLSVMDRANRRLIKQNRGLEQY